MTNPQLPPHFSILPRWLIGVIVVGAFGLGSTIIYLSWKQSTDASENLAFGEQDTDAIAAITNISKGENNEALIVHTVNALVTLKSITNYQALGILSVGAGVAFLAVGFALFLVGVDGAFRLQYETKSNSKIGFYATAPGLFCFALSGVLIVMGVTRKHDLQLGDYKSERSSNNADAAPALGGQDSKKSGLSIVPAPAARKAAALPLPAILAGFCFPRFIERNLGRSVGVTFSVGGGRARAISVAGRAWLNGSVLRVTFLDGDAALIKRVQKYASEWGNYANLRFAFVTTSDAEIRVSFKGVGRWSYIGTDARSIPIGVATMNIGSVAADTPDSELRGVVLHQFGHAIGLSDEYTNQLGKDQWNEEALIRSLGGPPNYWTGAKVETYIRSFSIGMINGETYDEKSIMRLPIPGDFKMDRIKAGWNILLSEGDKALIAGPRFYPKPPPVAASTPRSK